MQIQVTSFLSVSSSLRWLFLLGFIAFAPLYALPGCAPEIVQLDPFFNGTVNSNEGGTSKSEGSGSGDEKKVVDDGGTQDQSNPPNDGGPVLPPDVSCVAAPSTLQQLGVLQAKRANLIVGRLGSQAANGTIQVSLPGGWLVTPNIIQADSQGTFAFVLSRENQPASSSLSLPIYQGQKWCYLLSLNLSEDNNLKQLEATTEQTCKVGDSPTLSFRIPNSVRTVPEVFSSRSDVVSVQSSNLVQDKGQPSLEISIQCNQAGSVSLLVGGEDLAGTAISVKVE